MAMEAGSHWQAEEVDWALDDDDDYTHVVVSRIKEGTRKRLYEHEQGELNREMDKMYKRDYWEDPARAPWLEFAGLSIARAEAVLCFSERAHRASEAIVAEWRKEREERRRNRAAAHASEPESESESESELDPSLAAGGGEGHRLFLCFWWRSIVKNMAALLRYFLGKDDLV